MRSAAAATPIDLNAIARDAIRRAQLDEQPRIALRASFFDPLPTIAGSRERLVEAFSNLLVNARESLGGVEGAAIDIETEPDLDRDLVAVRILDNGPGMSDDLLERTFDPFGSAAEADAACAGKERADACGLSKACAILRDHRGTLTIRSRPGEGTCCVALIPIQRS